MCLHACGREYFPPAMRPTRAGRRKSVEPACEQLAGKSVEPACEQTGGIFRDVAAFFSLQRVNVTAPSAGSQATIYCIHTVLALLAALGGAPGSIAPRDRAQCIDILSMMPRHDDIDVLTARPPPSIGAPRDGREKGSEASRQLGVSDPATEHPGRR